MIDTMKVETNSKKWSKSVYFIFVPKFAYDGEIMKAEDFVKRVKISRIGCIASPGFPSLYKCKDEEGNSCNRGQEEIFYSAEACLAKHGPGFDDLWISNTKTVLANSAMFYQKQERMMKDRHKQSVKALKEFVLKTEKPCE